MERDFSRCAITVSQPRKCLASARILAGTIWIGAESGVYRFANGRVEEAGKGMAVSVVAAAAGLAVAAIGPLGQGVPRTTTLFRIWRVGDKLRSEAVMSLDSPGPLTIDPSGMILYPLPGKGWAEVRVADVAAWRPGVQLPVIRHAIANFPENGYTKVLRDHSGCLWIGADGGNVYDCGEGLREAPFHGANPRFNLHEGPDGKMVLWGDGLLAVGRPGSFRVATRANGLPGLVDAVSGADGTIWLGTTHGLYRFASPFQVEYWTIREGIAEAPWSIARSGRRVYAGLDLGRIVALSEDRQRWGAVANFENRAAVSAMAGAEDGTLVAGLRGGGAVLLGPDGKVLARTEKDRPKVGMRLVRTAEGEVWLGGSLLGRLTRVGSLLKWEEHPLLTKPSANVLAVRYEEHSRKLLACYNGGLVMRDEHGGWREFGARDGLSMNGCWSLAALPNGDIWYAYFGRAIALIRPAADGGINVRQYGADAGIPEPGNDTLDADQRGWLWRGGEVGIYVADAAEAEAGEWLQLDQSDGFPANGMNSGSVFVDNDRSLWWGSDNDLAHYLPPEDLVAPRSSPRIFVSAFSWDGASPRLAEAVAGLPHGSNATAHIGSLQFDRRNGLRLRYRILPEQSSWRESANLDLPLGTLSSGAHTLEVQARIFTGPWSPTLRQSMKVLGPVWNSWPLALLFAVIGATLAAGGYLLRRKRQTEYAALLPDLAPWRLGALLPEVDEVAGALLNSRFEVGALLARGGFANVMDAYDRVRKQRCAVKVFRGEVKDNVWVQRRFEQEVAALKKVRHPNVVSIYAHGNTPSGAPYLVMEFVEGKSLRETLVETGSLSPGRTARILRHLADALDAIHEQGVFHRDVKPENVIVRNKDRREEEAVLIDFSIAIVKDANETLYGLSRAAGSFDYMAPEQAIGYADASSDTYSLAKLAVEMLTGRQMKELLPDAALDLPDRVRELLKTLDFNLSQEAIDMLAGALEFDPAKRPNGSGHFAHPLVRDLESDVRSGAG